MISFNPKPISMPIVNYLHGKRKLTEEVVRDWEFCQLEGYSFKDRVCFPIRDEFGEIVSIAGRSLLPDVEIKAKEIAKYWHVSYPKMKHLFGLDRAKETIFTENLAILVEGQFDTIKMHQHGLCMTVALDGKITSEYHAELLSKYCDRVVLMLDGDVAPDFILAQIAQLVSWGFKAFPYFFGPGSKVDPDNLCDLYSLEDIVGSIQKVIAGTPVVNHLQNALSRLEGVQI